ncbi:MAG: alanine racemase [Elusimicrobia bacterium]|nr:alanine racemase [Elusimicrobiota bacterium]
MTASVVAGALRPSWIEISRSRLEHNYLRLKSFLVSSETRVMAVVKADGYGLGALGVAHELSRLGVRYFGVSSVDEGLALRRGGIEDSILILGSAFPFCDSYEAAIRHRLTVTVSSIEGAEELARAAAGQKIPIAAHVKMETGMQRIGARPSTCALIVEKLAQAPNIKLEGVYTHLADAKNEEFTLGQLAFFDQGLELVRRTMPRAALLIHCANSTAVARYPQAQRDLVRSGLAIYGAAPDFEPVMELKAKIVFLKRVPQGTTVSYGQTFRVPRESVVATLAIGYADGVPLNAWRRAGVLIHGERAGVAGVITMDMMMVDVTDVPGVRVGEEAVLIGSSGQKKITPHDWAQWAKMSVYEFLTGLGAPRLPKVMVA